MDMTHIAEISTRTELQLDEAFPLQIGAGSVDPDLIEPPQAEIDIDIEALLLFISH